ncbi:MAG: hypothetical protein ACLPX9_05865 [Rhodomicrobium sp.]
MNLTLRELKASKTFLSQAHILVAAVRALFFGASDGMTAARLNEIATRLDREIELVERLIAKAASNGEGAA